MTDYLNGSTSSQVQHSLYGVHDGSTTLVADLIGAKLDYENLKQIIDNDGSGTPLDLSFDCLASQLGVEARLCIFDCFMGMMRLKIVMRIIFRSHLQQIGSQWNDVAGYAAGK